MKKLVYFLLVSLLMFTSCKKDASNPVNTDTVPTQPTLASPTDTSSNIAVPVVLTWKESNGAKSYTLQVSASSSFSSFVFNKSDITTTTQQVPDLNYLAVYYWRVSATNSAGTSDWSKVWSFTTTGEAAFVPQLSLPANGAIDQKLSPVLRWNAVINASKYTLQISTNSSFTSFVFDEDSLNATLQQVTDLSGAIKYYWRVSAANNFGTKGWSETWSFTTGTIPQFPILLSPTDGAVDVVHSPTLTWSASIGATSYILQVSNNSSFTSFVFNQNTATTNKQITGLTISTRYYWRVMAVNNVGNSSWGVSWSFNTSGVCEGLKTVFYAEKTYHTVEVGSQCWLRENIDLGTMILGSAIQMDNGTIEKYCYDNDTSNCSKYGGLYQWGEAMAYRTAVGTKGICPTSWHIPTHIEFDTLKSTVKNDAYALEAVGQGMGTNTSGFSGLFAGYRTNGNFYDLGGYTDFWSSTENETTHAYYLHITYNIGSINNFNTIKKDYGFSIRCIKD